MPKNSDQQPLISIGMPVYNGEATIKRAIDGLLAQTYQNIEIIISDNGSTDQTENIIKAYHDDRIQYHRQKTNLGPTNNFAYVKNIASGDFFIWHSHDDWFDSDYLEQCFAVISKSSDIALVAGTSLYYEGDKVSYEGPVTEFLQDSPYERIFSYYKEVNDNGVYYGLIRKKFLDNIELRNVLGGDWLVIANLSWQGKIIHFKNSHVNRRLGGTSKSFKNIVRSLKLSSLNNFFPYCMIAFNASSEVILSRSYQNLNSGSKLFLAIQLFFHISGRFIGRKIKKTFLPTAAS